MLTEGPALARRRDASATRQGILNAGRRQFAKAGYEGALLRDIAAEAGVDAALINRYFGSKEGLFSEVLAGAVRSELLFAGDRAKFGRSMAKAAAGIGAPGHHHHDAEKFYGFQIILRAATSRVAAPLLNEAVQARFLGPIRDWLGGEHAEARARIIASVIVGLLVEAAVRGAELPEDERGPYVDRLGALLQDLVDR